jgi:hypothetical protein
MNGRDSSAIELKQIKGLSPTNLADDDPVWSMAEGCFQKIMNRYCWEPVLTRSCILNL